jgi:acetoacetyl-CoA synthetase
MKKILWSPKTTATKSPLHVERYIEFIKSHSGQLLTGPRDLYDWSVKNPELFWSSFLDFAEIHVHTKRGCVIQNPTHMPGAEWFPEYTLNFAENLLRSANTSPQKVALLFRSEDKVGRTFTYGELYRETARISSHFASIGLQAGERVAAITPNSPEAITAMLASSA